MRIYGKKAILASTRLLRSKIVDHGLILGYHRVTESDWDPFRISTSPGNFSQQLEFLARRARVIPLTELCRDAQAGEIRPNSVAITFDDGYADNLHVAKPILERLGMPATFFVASGFIGRRFWWDELIRIVRSVDLSATLGLRIQDIDHEWRCDSDSRSAIRDRLLREIYQTMLPLGEAEKTECIAQMKGWPGVSDSRKDDDRAMLAGEVRDLATNGFSIGSHTVSHPLLADMSTDGLRREIAQSRETLGSIVGREIEEFSYPNGSTSKETKRMVEKSGYVCACGSTKDVVWRQSDRYSLPRMWPANIPGQRFETWLGGWL